MSFNFAAIKEMFVKKEPEILCTIGVIGMVTTVGLAIGGTVKAVKAVEELEIKKKDENISEHAEDDNTSSVELTKPEIAKAVYKYYIPTAVVGAASTIMILRSKKLFASKLSNFAAVATAYKVSEKNLIEYKNKVKEVLGEKNDKKVNDALAQARTDANQPDENTIVHTGNGETLCREEITKRYFKSSKQAIESAINNLNYDAMSSMWTSVNDFFDAIEIDEIGSLGDINGWSVERGLLDPIFSTTLAADGTPVLTVDFRVGPGVRESYLR